MEVMKWPQSFVNPDLIKDRPHALLAADALCAWANTMMGIAPLPNFGESLVQIGKTIGMDKAATPENIFEFATEKGWFAKEEKP